MEMLPFGWQQSDAPGLLGGFFDYDRAVGAVFAANANVLVHAVGEVDVSCNPVDGDVFRTTEA